MVEYDIYLPPAQQFDEFYVKPHEILCSLHVAEANLLPGYTLIEGSGFVFRKQGKYSSVFEDNLFVWGLGELNPSIISQSENILNPPAVYFADGPYATKIREFFVGRGYGPENDGPEGNKGKDDWTDALMFGYPKQLWRAIEKSRAEMPETTIVRQARTMDDVQMAIDVLDLSHRSEPGKNNPYGMLSDAERGVKEGFIRN
ncbi:MAG TPA: hypothetical protein VGM08_00720, partial [Candidatus Saccharimonadales bacterium]